MATLVIDGRETSSQVVIAAGCLARLGEVLAEHGLGQPQAVVSNTTVGPLYAVEAASRLAAGEVVELADGERFKRWSEVDKLLAAWLDRGVHRRHRVLAIGGGVVTDTVGFAASVFLRGIEWVAVPTSLLAMVDASVGGKTGINLERGKNLVGTFWQPRLVMIDPTVLETLPRRELRAGLAEVVKVAWIGDRRLLELIEGPVDDPLSRQWAWWEEVIERAVQVKASVVAADEREAGDRQVLNLGHTIGHALESVTGYRRFLHGEAVAWGLLAVARLARRRGLLAAGGAAQLERAVAALAPLPPIEDLDCEAILDHLGRDKKLDERGVAWVLPTDNGVLRGQRVTAGEVRSVLEELAANWR